jgi:DNA-binding PadR family transcriptional regulator
VGDNTDVIQGTLDMLILKTLSLEPLHGFGVTRRIEQVTRGVFRINAGSLLTAFQRMERTGMIDAEWRRSITRSLASVGGSWRRSLRTGRDARPPSPGC